MQGAPAGSPARPSCEFLAGERANLHRPLDRDDAAVVVLLRSAADEKSEPAADVPAGALARLEIAEDVQLVRSLLKIDRPARLRAERERHPLDLPVLTAERPHMDVANAVLLVLAVAAARTHDVCPAEDERHLVARLRDGDRVGVDGGRIAAHAAPAAGRRIDVIDAERALDGLLLAGDAPEEDPRRPQLGLVERRRGILRLDGSALLARGRRRSVRSAAEPHAARTRARTRSGTRLN